MKTLILSMSLWLVSAPLLAQANYSGVGTPVSPTTGAPILDNANKSAIPPTLDRTSPVNSTGLENTGTPTNLGTGTGFGTSPGTSGTGTGFGTPSNLGTGTGFGNPSDTPTAPVDSAWGRGTGTGTGTGTGLGTPSNMGTGTGFGSGSGTGLGSGRGP